MTVKPERLGSNPFPPEFYAAFYRNAPASVLDTAGYSVLWKPHNMHCAPLAKSNGSGETLLDWYLRQPGIPAEAYAVKGRKPEEKGLLHRLDFATAGLVLLAKTQNAFDFLQRAQDAGRFRKGYLAFCDFYPQQAVFSSPLLPPEGGQGRQTEEPFCIRSRFRTFGPGGREVRPVFAWMHTRKACTGKEYETEIRSRTFSADGKYAAVRCFLRAGFRHQVRAHLAFCGFPISGDPLYNPLAAAGEYLQLFAVSLEFPDPEGGTRYFSLPPQDKTNR
ncbi:MAG: RNA pseudouridine synthase [Spirochaetes bacterium]|uniref:RNA pseudouridine synthase n=1 Tax=Candidatus Avitreponema avistercoris TaxID=2840705 RepID=A0A9D9HH17_9SPIR|nr:RNA pseudouridine synthase [Candidatus Avitreponema avistercoris]